MYRIFVLEDDLVSARLAVHMMEKQGHHVRTAPRAAEAWSQIVDDPIDLLVLDTDLGGEWGWDFLARLRRSSIFRAVPVIVYSTLWRRDVVRRYFTLGVQGMLVKPYSADRLAQEIARLRQAPWRGSVFASARDAAGPARDKQAAEFADLARAMDEAGAAARALPGDPFNRAIQDRLVNVKRAGERIGFVLLAEMVDAILDAANAPRLDKLETLVTEWPLVTRLAQQHARDLGASGAPAASEKPAAVAALATAS